MFVQIFIRIILLLEILISCIAEYRRINYFEIECVDTKF